jgi:hypothetical protein
MTVWAEVAVTLATVVTYDALRMGAMVLWVMAYTRMGEEPEEETLS